jgi:acyl-CoA thioester hydrolase
MFITTVSPRFGDIDGLGHINNTVLPVWFEIGRNSIFRLFSPDLNLSPDKWHLILVRTEFDFLRQMYFRSDVEIRTFIVKIGNSSFTVGHEAWQEGELKVKGQAVLHWSSVKELFPSLLTLFRSNPIISYSNHSSLNLSLFTCGSNA